MNLSLADLEALPERAILGPCGRRKASFTGVSTDSRTVVAGNLFVAIRGEQFDGHAFVGDAITKGARAVVVEGSYKPGSDLRVPHIVVDNTTRTLGELALAYRKKFAIPVIAVGGSNGKTTTKEMIARVLRSRFSVLSTAGNLNNHLGVPQTLFRLRASHEIAVVEIGTNHPGEITFLCRILEPTHGLVTTIGREHLEYFKTLDGVAREEVSLYRDLAESGGLAFVNADDIRVVRGARDIRRRVSYGMRSRSAAVRGRIESTDRTGCAVVALRRQGRSRPAMVHLRIPGSHNALNAVAAAAVALEFGVSLSLICAALESFRPASKRMEVVRIDGFTVLNDSYNANQDSTMAALRTLASVGGKGKKIAVLADMLELGSGTAQAHARIGREAARLGIDYLLTHGEGARQIHRAAGLRHSSHYEQKSMLAQYLLELAGRGDTILVKGSRGMSMETIVTFLRERHRRQPAP